MRIDVYYDLLCPFCFLAKRCLDIARREVPDADVEVVHRPFLMHPEFPRGPHDFRATFIGKYGADARIPMWDTVTERGRQVGIDFCFYEIEHGFNSITAHRLVHRAKQRGIEGPVLEDLYSAFFERAQYLGDTALLADIGARHGLDCEEMKHYLDGDQDEEEIFAASEQARREGVTGMPFHRVDGEPFQPEVAPEPFIDLLKQASR